MLLLLFWFQFGTTSRFGLPSSQVNKEEFMLIVAVEGFVLLPSASRFDLATKKTST